MEVSSCNQLFQRSFLSISERSKTGCSYKAQFYGVLSGTSKLHRQKEDDGHTFILTLVAALKRKYVDSKLEILTNLPSRKLVSNNSVLQISR